MRSFFLSTILGAAPLCLFGLTASPVDAQDWRFRNRPSNYVPGVDYYMPAYPTAYSGYNVYYRPSDSSNVYVGPMYSTYWPGYTIYYPRTILYSAPTNVVYPNRPMIYRDYP
jgi:hypothetical protein